MPLAKDISTPFGAAVGYHCAMRVEGNLADPTLALIVHSWPTEDDWTANAGKGPTFVWYVPLPLAMLSGPLSASSCEDVLAGNVIDGSPFDGATVVPPVGEVDALKLRQWAGIKQTRDLLIVASIDVDGVSYDATERSQQRVLTAMVCMRAADEGSRDWVCADNVTRTLTVEQLEAVGVAIDSRNSELTLTAASLRAALDAATTPAEVLAVVWPVGE